MQKKKDCEILINAKKILFIAFLVAQCIIWIVLLFANLSWYTELSYATVVFCFVFSLLFLKKGKDGVFQSIAFFFTCIADYFLVLLGGENKTLAMCAFLCAQIAYACRVYLLSKNDKEKRLQILFRVIFGVIGASAVFIVLREKTEALFVISVVYYVQLLLSMIFSFLHFKDGLSVKLLAIGLLSFALCDISIGFDFLIDIFSLGEESILYYIVYKMPVSMVALFYPPSQTLLFASAKVANRMDKTESI